MKIEVTAEHIKAGRRGSCSRCPVALAVHEATGLCVRVIGDRIELWRALAHVALWAATVSDFTLAFDSGQEVQPFTFDLDVPERLLA